jgi:hypothetical protein
MNDALHGQSGGIDVDGQGGVAADLSVVSRRCLEQGNVRVDIDWRRRASQLASFGAALDERHTTHLGSRAQSRPRYHPT